MKSPYRKLRDGHRTRIQNTLTMAFNWRSFIYNINNNGVVPVIGNDLSMVRFLKSDLVVSDMPASFVASGMEDGDTIIFNLYDYLAFRLWDIYGAGNPPPPYQINKVVLQLYKQNVSDNDINNAVKNEVSNLTDEQIFLEPYRKLAEISGFDTILTVNADNFMERAFEAAEIPVNESVNYSIPLPALDQDRRQDKALVSIYNLMGNIQGYNFALTDEQSLEYLHMLQKGEDTICKNLFDAIKDKNILLIGCSFPDWFMRFFIRTIAKERFKNGVKTKYVACDRTLQDIELSYFLQHNAAKIIRIGTDPMPMENGEGMGDQDRVYRDSIEFIDEMHKIWKGYMVETGGRPRFKEKVFLSYSWDDKKVVERLKNAFEKNGVGVFFDDDELKVGEDYNKTIKNYIKNCDFFVPIISKNALGDSKRYVYDKEWRSAIVLDGYKDVSYIRPYIIDDTSPIDSDIPEEMRGLNIGKAPDLDNFGPLVRNFIKENKLTSLTEGNA